MGEIVLFVGNLVLAVMFGEGFALATIGLVKFVAKRKAGEDYRVAVYQAERKWTWFAALIGSVGGVLWLYFVAQLLPVAVWVIPFLMAAWYVKNWARQSKNLIGSLGGLVLGSILLYVVL